MVAARIFSIAFTVRVALVLAVLLPVLWLRLLFTRDEREAFRLVRACARRVIRGAGIRVSLRVHGPATDTPAMFVSNHTSLADAAVLLAVLPADVRFVANHVFADYPILGAAIRAASAHIVDRGSWRSRGECGRTMATALGAGQSLFVFPEGTTSANGALLPFRNGAFRAAVQCAAPVVPVVLRGTRALFPPDTYRLQNATVDIDLLAPIHPAGRAREAVADLKQQTIAAISARLEC